MMQNGPEQEGHRCGVMQREGGGVCCTLSSRTFETRERVGHH